MNEAVHLNTQKKSLSTNLKYAPSAEQMKNAETNVFAALMSLVPNTRLCFLDTSTLMDNWQTGATFNSNLPLPQYISNIVSKITHNVIKVDMDRIVEKFLQSCIKEARRFNCASCGMKAFKIRFNQSHFMPIEELDSL